MALVWHVHGGMLQIGMLQVRPVLALLDVLELLDAASVVLLVQDVVRIVLEILQAREGRLLLELQDQEVKLVREPLHAEIRFVLERLRKPGACSKLAWAKIPTDMYVYIYDAKV